MLVFRSDMLSPTRSTPLRLTCSLSGWSHGWRWHSLNASVETGLPLVGQQLEQPLLQGSYNEVCGLEFVQTLKMCINVEEIHLNICTVTHTRTHTHTHSLSQTHPLTKDVEKTSVQIKPSERWRLRTYSQKRLHRGRILTRVRRV